jgi:hypothetical protein
MKDFEKQEKKIKELKSHGQSKKAAVSCLHFLGQPDFKCWDFLFAGKETEGGTH